MRSKSRQDQDRQWRILLAEQIQENSRLFFRMAYGVLRDADAAQDACQFALCRAWEHRDQINEPAALGAWLSRTLLNHCFAVIRRQRTEQRVLEGRSRADASSPMGVDDPLALGESVARALEQLHEPTRSIVVLRVMHGMRGKEVAAKLGCSPPEVSRRLHEGMDQLRHLLADWRSTVGV